MTTQLIPEKNIVHIQAKNAVQIIGHLQTFSYLLETMTETASNDISERFFGIALDDVKEEIRTLRHNLEIAQTGKTV